MTEQRSDPSGSSDHRLPVPAKLAFGIADLGGGLLWQSVTLFLMYFSTEVLGIAPATAGFIVMAALFWDGFVDVLMGGIADRTRTRWGRYRPWLLFGAPVMALSFVLMFTAFPGLGPTATVVVAIVCQLAFRTGYALVSIPYGSLTSALTDDSFERSSLTGYRMVFGGFGGLMVALGWMPLVQMFGAGDAGKGFFWTALCFGLLSVLFVWVCFAGTRERAVPQQERSYSLKDLPGLARVNPPFLIVVGCIALGSTGYAVTMAMLPYFFKFIVADESILGPAVVVTTIVSALCMPLWLAVTKRIGKKRVWMLGAIWGSLGGLAFYLVMPTEFVMLMIFFVVMAVGGPANTLSTFAVLPDTVEYGEWKSGKRVEAGLFSAMILGQKFAIGVGSWLGGIALSLSGYTQAGGIPVGGKDTFMAVMFLGPIAFNIGLIVLLSFYPITPQLHARLVRALAWRSKRRAAAGSAE